MIEKDSRSSRTKGWKKLGKTGKRIAFHSINILLNKTYIQYSIYLSPPKCSILLFKTLHCSENKWMSMSLNIKKKKQTIISKEKNLSITVFLLFFTSFMRPFLPSCPSFGMKKTHIRNKFHLKITFI